MTDLSKSCFVIGPISGEASQERNKANWLLEDIIRPVAESERFSLKVVRADLIASPGDIPTQVINHVIDSRVVVADLANANPNAFYELALRHMANAPVIHLSPKGSKPPFDVSTFRYISYSFDTVEERNTAREKFAEQLHEVLKEEYHVQNPVTIARGLRHSDQERTPERDSLLAMISNLSDRVEHLEVLLENLGVAAKEVARNLSDPIPVDKRLMRSFFDLFTDR